MSALTPRQPANPLCHGKAYLVFYRDLWRSFEVHSLKLATRNVMIEFAFKWSAMTQNGKHPKPIPFSPEDVAERGISETSFRRAMRQMEGLYVQKMEAGGGARKAKYVPIAAWQTPFQDGRPALPKSHGETRQIGKGQKSHIDHLMGGELMGIPSRETGTSAVHHRAGRLGSSSAAGGPPSPPASSIPTTSKSAAVRVVRAIWTSGETGRPMQARELEAAFDRVDLRECWGQVQGVLDSIGPCGDPHGIYSRILQMVEGRARRRER